MMHVVKAFSEGLKFCGLFWDIVIGVGENIDQWSQGNGDVIRGWKVVDDPLKDDVFWEESGFGAHFGGLNVLSDRFIVCVVRDGEWVFETYDVKA